MITSPVVVPVMTQENEKDAHISEVGTMGCFQSAHPCCNASPGGPASPDAPLCDVASVNTNMGPEWPPAVSGQGPSRV